jgi:ATP-dependent Clp protease adaptor protein ClpS
LNDQLRQAARFSYGRGVTLEAMAPMRRGAPIPSRMREICMVTMRDHKSNGPEQHAASDMPSGLLAEVRLLNDDQTTMEFVVQVLEDVFGKDRETATRIMLEAHSEGFGVCGIYPYDIAEAKVTEVLSFTRRHGHPLQCVLERSSSTARNGE